MIMRVVVGTITTITVFTTILMINNLITYPAAKQSQYNLRHFDLLQLHFISDFVVDWIMGLLGPFIFFF